MIFKSNNNLKSNFREYGESGAGFTMLEMVIYIFLLSLVLLLVSSFTYYFVVSDNQTRGDREVAENARRVLETINYEINGAKGIYSPTTSGNQLSLETPRYLQTGETTSYIDFFICGTSICLKKESQSPVYLTGDAVQVTALTFTQITIGGISSIKTNLTIKYNTITNGVQPSITFTSTASLRSNK